MLAIEKYIACEMHTYMNVLCCISSAIYRVGQKLTTIVQTSVYISENQYVDHLKHILLECW